MLQNISLWKAACDMHRTSPVVMRSVNTGHVTSGIVGAPQAVFVSAMDEPGSQRVGTTLGCEIVRAIFIWFMRKCILTSVLAAV